MLSKKKWFYTEVRQVGVGRPAVGQHVGPLLHPPLDDLEESGLVPLVILADLEEALASLPGWGKNGLYCIPEYRDFSTAEIGSHRLMNIFLIFFLFCAENQ